MFKFVESFFIQGAKVSADDLTASLFPNLLFRCLFFLKMEHCLLGFLDIQVFRFTAHRKF